MTTLLHWDGQDLTALLALDRIGPGHLRNRHGDANRNGRAYGGQSLGQALMAAAIDVPDDRLPTMLQFVFLRGVQPQRPIDFHVSTLQQGKRFTTRHVRGTQGAGAAPVFDAQVSFAGPSPLFEHAAAWTPPDVDPAAIAPFDGSTPWEQDLARRSGYPTLSHACIEFRMTDGARQVGQARAGDTLRYWFRVGHALPPSPALHAAAFAYLSDWWINFPAVGPYMRDVPPGRRLYVASLNHCLWLHRPFAPDQWLHVSTDSPCTYGGRGLAMARVHDQAGLLVASATQECVMQIADDAVAS